MANVVLLLAVPRLEPMPPKVAPVATFSDPEPVPDAPLPVVLLTNNEPAVTVVPPE